MVQRHPHWTMISSRWVPVVSGWRSGAYSSATAPAAGTPPRTHFVGGDPAFDLQSSPRPAQEAQGKAARVTEVDARCGCEAHFIAAYGLEGSSARCSAPRCAGAGGGFAAGRYVETPDLLRDELACQQGAINGW